MIQHYLSIPYGNKLDTIIADIEVDIKFTIGQTWTIPSEALGELCLLVTADDNKSTFQVGLLRTTDDVLNPGRNRDGKRGVSAAGKKKILWLVPNGELPKNVLLSIPPETARLIFLKSQVRNELMSYLGSVRVLFSTVLP
ncbi:hypothetical protein HMSSN139_07830 [Paenibacillus sp. HMSSN-139]|nr:hypothetical protein HMSSN139_07830 [Paenibacillus sp. HMSSN-139]